MCVGGGGGGDFFSQLGSPSSVLHAFDVLQLLKPALARPTSVRLLGSL